MDAGYLWPSRPESSRLSVPGAQWQQAQTPTGIFIPLHLVWTGYRGVHGPCGLDWIENRLDKRRCSVGLCRQLGARADVSKPVMV